MSQEKGSLAPKNDDRLQDNFHAATAIASSPLRTSRSRTSRRATCARILAALRWREQGGKRCTPALSPEEQHQQPLRQLLLRAGPQSSRACVRSSAVCLTPSKRGAGSK